MRPRRHEAVAHPAPDAPNGAEETGPTRTCVLTRRAAPRPELVRLALTPDGRVLPDVRARAPGRGAWLGVTRDELAAAVANKRLRGALARAFKGAPVEVPADLADLVADALLRHALDRLGLEARAGTLVTGTERIEAAARAGRLAALYHASDAGEDGCRRLAQAWRVGLGEEGGGRRGLALPLARPILSVALGRENVVHLGLADQAAADRAGDALGRWLRFAGHPFPAPCGTAPQGASAPRPAAAPPAEM